MHAATVGNSHELSDCSGCRFGSKEHERKDMVPKEKELVHEDNLEDKKAHS